MSDLGPCSAFAERQGSVDEHPFWYHTLDLGGGVVTPGWFDLRGALERMPWPELAGRRCLDIGTFDGFFAFYMERMGAAEVVAVDIEDHLLWDWPPDYRSPYLRRDPGFSGPAKGDGFRLAAQLTGSQVAWRALSIYDLDPDVLGTFDVVVCGSLLLHLRDPLRALEAVRRVTSGYFLSSEQIEMWLSILGRGRPLLTLNGSGKDCQWFNFNASGHRRLLYAAGFEVLTRSRPYLLAFNAHPRPPRTLRSRVDRFGHRLLTGSTDQGILHQALLASSRV